MFAQHCLNLDIGLMTSNGITQLVEVFLKENQKCFLYEYCLNLPWSRVRIGRAFYLFGHIAAYSARWMRKVVSSGGGLRNSLQSNDYILIPFKSPRNSVGSRGLQKNVKKS